MIPIQQIVFSFLFILWERLFNIYHQEVTIWYQLKQHLVPVVHCRSNALNSPFNTNKEQRNPFTIRYLCSFLSLSDSVPLTRCHSALLFEHDMFWNWFLFPGWNKENNWKEFTLWEDSIKYNIEIHFWFPFFKWRSCISLAYLINVLSHTLFFSTI